MENIIEKKERKEQKGKAHQSCKDLESIHFIVSHCNIGVNEVLFNASFAYWRDTWILDTSAHCHMKFRREFFEDLNDNVHGIVYFVDNSSLKCKGIGTIGLKLSSFPCFMFKKIFYLLEL